MPLTMSAGDRHPYAPGTLLPGSSYVLGRVLGMGGTAAVYEAEDETCGRRVVVKIVRPDVARKGAFTAAQMQREARTLVALQAETDHVVEVITAGITGDAQRLPYYVMEQLNGQTLRSALERRAHEGVPTALDEAISIGIDLSLALDHAHRLGVTHLDVKPENAFVHQKRDGSLIMKLLDFGISSMLGMTLGGFRGTYRYAAPEQIRGERVSAATDLYSLGLVLYEALALQKPFERRGERLTPAALAHAQCSVMPAPLGPLRPDAPESLVALVTQCLAKRAEERPPSAAFLATRLRGIKEQVVLPKPTGLSYLETLTGVVSPVAGALPAAYTLPVAGTLPLRAIEPPPRSMIPASELFITAVPAPLHGASAPPPAPSPTFEPVAFGGRSLSTAPAAVRRSRAPRIAGIAVGLVAAGGIVGLVLGAGSSFRRSSAAGAPSSDSFSGGPVASASAVSSAPIRPEIVPSSSPPVAVPPAEPPSSTPPPALPAPAAPRAQPAQSSHGSHSSPPPPAVDRPAPVVVPPPVPPSAPPPRPPATPPGITTQKDWF